jgi:hypothetical protein
VSAKKHVLIPRAFASAADVPRAALSRFHRMTGEECKALERAGRIEKIGSKLWRLTEEACATAASWETGNGLLSLAIERDVRDVLRFEMAARPCPDLTHL